MDLELKIENFGPIDEANIQVGPFTVFAGPNNTGKTFVAKMLYSIIRARDANHALVFFDETARLIESELQLAALSGRVVGESPLSAIRRGLQKIESILREAFPSYPLQNELDKLNAVQPELMAAVEEIKVHFQTFKNSVGKKEEGDPFGELYIDILEEFFRDMVSVIELGWKIKVIQNACRNFQAFSISHLKRSDDSYLCFSVEEVGKLQEKEGSFEFTFYRQIIQNMRSFPESFYLESPFYWKLKSALESIKLDSHYPFGKSLNGVPAYFYDMAVALRRRRIEHPFSGIHKSLHAAMGGKISLSEAGDLEFQQKGKSIPLSLTSAGVANMGMLALLIERGALERGSFLFIDEPESNLHPAWQVEMAEFLFELARQGVNVVISTHSMTILKWLEVHVKEKPEDRELVRLNKFPPDAEWNDDMDAVMAEVKQSLTKPFSDLYIKGL